MLPVGDAPILEINIRRLVDDGVEDVAPAGEFRVMSTEHTNTNDGSYFHFDWAAARMVATTWLQSSSEHIVHNHAEFSMQFCKMSVIKDLCQYCPCVCACMPA